MQDSPTQEVPLSVVVLSFNREPLLAQNLPNLAGNAAAFNYELIVVDNGSSDGSVDRILSIKARYPDMKALLLKENVGVAQGRNVGWKAARGELVLTLDDDVELSSTDIRAIASSMESSNAGIAYPVITDAETDRRLVPPASAAGSLANYPGACHIIRRAVFDAIGYHDTTSRFGGEELEFSMRARAAGFGIAQFEEVVVRHRSVGQTQAARQRRLESWAQSHAEVLARRLSLPRALLFTSRLGISWTLRGFENLGVLGSWLTIRATIQGLRNGRKEFQPLPQRLQRWYADTEVRPDLGNVPLVAKVTERLLWMLRKRTSGL